MESALMANLVAWKDSPIRKPLILEGARQVGKTYLLEEFGKRYFENVLRVNFQDPKEELFNCLRGQLSLSG
jgi:predicted AAA+ superfamily ATPase